MTARGRACSTCDMAELNITDGEPVFECHLNPPMTTAVDLNDPEPEPIDDGLGVQLTVEMHRYPRVRPDDWCGAWVAEGEDRFPVAIEVPMLVCQNCDCAFSASDLVACPCSDATCSLAVCSTCAASIRRTEESR